MTPHYLDSHVRLLCGDATTTLGELPAGSVHCVVTSPPYWSLRNYHVPGQIGLEPTIDLYVEHIVQVFREVRRVLRDDGLCFVNLGDSYAGSGVHAASHANPGLSRAAAVGGDLPTPVDVGLKPLDMCNIPHRVAQALQADGWYWRDTWHWIKRSPMPESLSGTRWVRCRVKTKSQDYSEYTQMGKLSSGEVSGGHRNRDANGGVWRGGAEYEPCPGCAACTYQDQPQRNGYVLRRGSWRYTSAVEYVFLFSKQPGYTALQEQVRTTYEDRPSDIKRALQGGNYHGKHQDGSNGHITGWPLGDPRTGANPRNYGFLASEPMDMQRCAGCGRVYLGPEFKRSE